MCLLGLQSRDLLGPPVVNPDTQLFEPRHLPLRTQTLTYPGATRIKTLVVREVGIGRVFPGVWGLDGWGWGTGYSSQDQGPESCTLTLFYILAVDLLFIHTFLNFKEYLFLNLFIYLTRMHISMHEFMCTKYVWELVESRIRL